jgi:hypothetical protein
MWEKLKAWVERHKISAHSVAIGWAFLVSFYYGNTKARSYIDYEAHEAYIHFPKWLQGAVVSLLIPLFIYWKSNKKTNVT